MPKAAKPRAIKAPKPIVISPVPSSSMAAGSRPISAKRVSRMRLNWFVVGSVFGVGVSFFMNLLVTAVVIPEYDAVMARHGNADLIIAEAKTAAPAREQSSGGLLAALNFRRNTEEAKLADVADTVETEVAKSEETEPASITYPRNVTLEVSSGDTLVGMLLENHVPSNEAHNVIAALKHEFNPGTLRVGQKISLTLARHETLGDAAAVKELAIKLPNLSTVEVERAENGGFNVAAIKEKLETQAYRATGTVRSSLSQAAADAGIGGAAFAEITKAFSYDVDFQREIHPGDKLEVLLDRKVAKSGQVGGYGNVRYAALTLLGKKHEIFLFKDGSGFEAWYDAKGNAVKKSLLRTPLNVVRITSGFGMRHHPILGYSKFHQGVDFGASTGTPIMAAGDGVIKQRGWVNGYGNFVLIQHNGTYSTGYGHMSRFGSIRVGSRVRQGQIIGYVGMTGRATGPHLHYEVRQNGHQVNPAAKQFNLASGLTGRQLTAFNAKKASIAKELASLSQPKATAQVASR